MFLLDDGTVVYSASDLANAAACEFAVLRALDAKLGRVEPVELAADAMLDRAARLGDRHEERYLAEYLDRFGTWDPTTGRGVAQIERPPRGRHNDRTSLEAKQVETIAALRTGADVVFQAGFFDGRFGGWADFLVREVPDDGGPAAYAVYDTKLARHAKITALLQVAAYADQLLAAGLRPAEEVHLILGDRTVTSHRLGDLLPVYQDRRARLERMLDDRADAGAALGWDEGTHRACGRCEVCAPEIESRRDVLLVAGMRTTQRARLHAAGIGTIDDLAASTGPVEGIGATSLDTLRAQARLQVAQGPAGSVRYELFAPEAIAALPAPDAGDIFFDFEGDPLWTEEGSTDWGLEYLFGVVELPEQPVAGAEPVFRPFWAHDRAQEKQALVDFLAYVTERRERHPGMHIYHYAAYERSALLRLAGRHGVGEEAIDTLLRAGVLVDLYATVRASLRTGQRSYSIKQLEPLYMDSTRSGEVTTAGDSIVEYADACLVRDNGDLTDWARRLERIAEYNRYDCVSTLRLRDWLLARANEQGVDPRPAVEREPGADAEPDAEAPEHDALAESLRAFADAGPRAPRGAVADAGAPAPATRTADQQAVAMLAASLSYHWREHKPFWWAHFDRLVSDPEEWVDTRSAFVADQGSVTVVTPWHVPPRARTSRRVLQMAGRLEPGTDLRPGSEVFALYDPPLPACANTSATGRRGWTTKATVLEVRTEVVGDGVRDVLLLADGLRGEDTEHDALPMAIAPGAPPKTHGIAAAIRAIAGRAADALPGLPHQPAIDLLRRIPPRTVSGSALPAADDGPRGYIDAITGALLDLDGSYLAVQGPPGTGKTYTGARVIAALVARGRRVGVVAQSHAVVENMLRGIAEAGVATEQIGKKANGTADPGLPWTVVPADAFGSFYARQAGGYVVGGTTWDFTNAKRLPDEQLDLLVVDEAGQFSLADTVAVSAAAHNLLLLGDPQQLPQVSQGRHPEPVDRSALGWLTDGHDTLPSELGYFLAHTWRMHPALCEAVSRLSYEGRLTAMPCTAERSLEGVEPGVRSVLVEHEGNAVASAEEAAEVVAQVRSVVGRRWRDPANPHDPVDRPLEPSDVLVVAAYNAQVWTIRRALDAARSPTDLSGVRVGTVDKFQGQQAPVVIVSTAASSADDVPRGMEFLLNRNRINVAVSRGQWCAVVVRSAGLTDYLPSRPTGLAELGAFLGLTERSHAGASGSGVSGSRSGG